MSMTEQEARSKCPMGINECGDCPRLLDDCDGNEEYQDKQNKEEKENE